jgi:copper transport protein
MSRRTLLRCLTGGLVALVALVGGAGPAGAHADLLSTDPGYGAELASGPDRAIIRYNLPVEVKGAQVKLERRAGTPRAPGRALRVGRPAYASPDRRDVSLPLPELGTGSYVLTWFLFGSDGDVMGGELAFQLLPAGGTSTPGTEEVRPGGPDAEQRSFAPLSRAQDAARFGGFASLTVLLGGVTFVALLWRAGARVRRTRVLLWASLAGALLATAGALGLKGAAVQGQSALGAFSPSALTALNDTHVGRVLVARLGFLLLAVPVVALLTSKPHHALRSHRWVLGAAASGLGVVATHGMLSHAYARGMLASVADAVHLGAVAVWLGGLTMLAVVVLPRRRGEELSLLVPRWSRLAFASVATAAVAGTALLLLLSPRWTALPSSDWGRFLMLKLLLVALLLAAASRARDFVRQRLPDLALATTVDLTVAEASAEAPVLVGVGATGPRPGPGTPSRSEIPVDPVPLRPFVSAVTTELCIAASILAATAVLVGQPPPT